MALAKTNSRVICYVNEEAVHKEAKEKCITRSMAAVEKACNDNVDIFVFGNAPTALFRLKELIKEGKANPKLIIAVPVGFVGAAESKENMDDLNIPYIRVKGRKGGSTVAAAIVNALMYMVVQR
jgi:precorrin-8X/cobalt-precorrin-8 methylmutase